MDLCKIGIHDYQYVKGPTAPNIIRKEIGIEKSWDDVGAREVYIKICLKCGKIVDTYNPKVLKINEEKIEYERLVRVDNERTEQAKNMYNEAIEKNLK